MWFRGYIKITTGDFKEYYEINDETYSIGDPEDFPPSEYKFHIKFLGNGEYPEVENLTIKHSLFWLKKITENLLIDYITDEHFKSDEVEIWIIS